MQNVLCKSVSCTNTPCDFSRLAVSAMQQLLSNIGVLRQSNFLSSLPMNIYHLIKRFERVTKNISNVICWLGFFFARKWRRKNDRSSLIKNWNFIFNLGHFSAAFIIPRLEWKIFLGKGGGSAFSASNRRKYSCRKAVPIIYDTLTTLEYFFSNVPCNM